MNQVLQPEECISLNQRYRKALQIIAMGNTDPDAMVQIANDVLMDELEITESPKQELLPSEEATKAGQLGDTREWAATVLQHYAEGDKVSDLYDDDGQFASALRVLAGPDFEYPDYSYLTVDQATQKAKRMGQMVQAGTR